MHAIHSIRCLLEAALLEALWLTPPMALARLGSSRRICENFEWGPSDDSPGGTGKTTLRALPSLELDETCLDIAELTGALDSRLRRRPGRDLVIEDAAGDAEQPSEAVVVDARGAAAPETCRMVCGKRAMHLWADLPADPAVTDRSEILTGPGFWMFLLPISKDRMSVQIATPAGVLDRDALTSFLSAHKGDTPSLAACFAESLKERSHMPDVTVAIAPRLGPAPTTPMHFSAGDRAMTFDPICGEGTGQGIKSAILAVAAANALQTDHRPDEVARHVAAWLSFAFGVHLKHCANYYAAITAPEFWRAEIAFTRRGLAQLGGLPRRDQGCLFLRFDEASHRSHRKTGPRLETLQPTHRTLARAADKTSKSLSNGEAVSH